MKPTNEDWRPAEPVREEEKKEKFIDEVTEDFEVRVLNNPTHDQLRRALFPHINFTTPNPDTDGTT